MTRPSTPELRPLFVAEPPAAFLARPPVVVDCSVLAAWAFAEPEAHAAVALLGGKSLRAPRLLEQEIVNVAATKVRRGMPAADAERALTEFLGQAIELVDPDLPAQLRLACRYGLSGYDAAYLWLAAEWRAPLITFDKRLAESASRHLQSL